MQDSFKEQDKEKVIEFLNFIYEKAEFNNWTTKDTVEHFKLLAYMQKELLPKIEKNICEVTKVVEPPKKEASTPKKGKK